MTGQALSRETIIGADHLSYLLRVCPEQWLGFMPDAHPSFVLWAYPNSNQKDKNVVVLVCDPADFMSLLGSEQLK